MCIRDRVEVVSSCAKLGIEGKHLLCMQGPFSREMNIALIHQFDIAWMVSKESVSYTHLKDACTAYKNFCKPLKKFLYAVQASLIACLVTLFEIFNSHAYSSECLSFVNSFLSSESEMNFPPFS